MNIVLEVFSVHVNLSCAFSPCFDMEIRGIDDGTVYQWAHVQFCIALCLAQLQTRQHRFTAEQFLRSADKTDLEPASEMHVKLRSGRVLLRSMALPDGLAYALRYASCNGMMSCAHNVA